MKKNTGESRIDPGLTSHLSPKEKEETQVVKNQFVCKCSPVFIVSSEESIICPKCGQPMKKVEQKNTIADLSRRVREINISNGWRNDAKGRSIKDVDYTIVKLALIHTEVSEAIESVRVEDEFNFVDELADIVIRTLDLADILEIDIEQAILNKLEVVANREYQHGGKKV